MGIIPGKNLKLIQRYSLHGPICIKIMGSTIMIRKKQLIKFLFRRFMMSKKPTIALIGNPNSGKTAVFNQLSCSEGIELSRRNR